jgi:mannose-6-phosphate isomerase-like protein (cupin superfamily)
MTVVRKPWGKEVWLELNDRYCYKRIYLNAGERTSFQYHEKKQETNYIISGEAEIWLEDDSGEVQKMKMGPNEFFTVVPPRKHRVVALTDLVLQEVSTPEVDDVIRIQDDSGRPDGRLEHEHQQPALCIIAAGKGTRMEHLTEHTHKGLLPVEDKAVISHIIEKTPFEYDIVVALGHLGELVKEYCEMCYPDRNFIFCQVDKIEGEGTGPGYSIRACKKHLQRPFYFVVADCMIRDELPPLSCNWLGVYPTGIPELYSTVDFDGDNNITSFVNKCSHGHDHAFVGLAGIVDYKIFWDQLGSSGEVVEAFYNCNAYETFKAHLLDWIDVGTIDGYLKVRNNKYSLPKTTGEAVYKIGDRCIRLFPNATGHQRGARADKLRGIVPQDMFCSKHMLSYKWEEGSTLYDKDDLGCYTEFLTWCLENLWSIDGSEAQEGVARKFYVEKTFSRAEKYIEGKLELRSANGKSLRDIDSYLSKIDWEYIGDCLWTKRFHGDLQFDNILSTPSGFVLIDWRDSFGGQTMWGDVYYDLAKLYGGTLVNYKLMKDSKNINLNSSDNSVDFFYKHTDSLTRFLPILEDWIVESGFDLNKVKLITGLVWLNMSPLHEQPFSDMLFYKSKEMLDHVLD